MAFFEPVTPVKSTKSKTASYSLELLHKSECAACPLNSCVGLRHPNMDPTGSKKPLIYILGEAPGAEEDKTGKHFAGKDGKYLRRRLPEHLNKKIRWNTCVRTRPPENRPPSQIEIECCRPSITRDIEKTKPKAIFGFGNIPLQWATGLSGISFWCGRRIAVQIGSHACWFYPFYHPSYLLKVKNDKRGDGYGSEEAFAFEKHLEKAIDEIEHIPDAVVHSPKKAQSNLTLIDGSNGDSDLRKIIKHLEKMASERYVGFDYETSALRPYGDNAKVLTAALASKDTTLAFPLRHRQSPWSKRQLGKLTDAFVEFLEESDCLKVVHQLGFELEWSVVHFGEKTLRNGRWGCSYSQAYILDERYGAGALSLDGMCIQYFGLSIKKLNPVNRANLDAVPLKDVLPYNAVDARYHRLLFLKQEKRIREEGLEDQYYHNVERQAGMTLMSVKGLPVSQKVAKRLDKKHTGIVEKIDTEIKELPGVKKFEKKFGREFNAGSNKDVKTLMNDILGNDVKSVDVEQLQPLKGKAPKLIVRRRKSTKLLSTYIHPSMEGSPILFKNKFHAIYGTCSTRTWRTSCDSPNEQNWPKYEGREVRKIVRAPRGHKIVAFDYAGIQARNVAMESKDKVLVEAFKHRYDIHSDWMERIARHYPKWIKEGVKKLHEKDIKKHYRQQAKNKAVFPAFFGAGAGTIASGLGVPFEIGDAIGKEFRKEFAGIDKWHKKLRKNYRKYGYVTGLSGFRRRAPVAPTEVINTPIQSDEALIVLDALIRLTDLQEECFYPNIEIHDDLTFIWPKVDVEKNAEVVIGMMLDVPFEWAKIVPMGVEMSIGDDWADLEPVGEWYSDEWFGKMADEERAKL